MSYSNSRAYDDYAHNRETYLNTGQLSGSNAHLPSVDITSMQQPYAGSYSEASWQTPRRPEPAQTLPSAGGLETLSQKKEKKRGKQLDKRGVVGMNSMSHWSALRFLVYVGTRLTQLVVAIVCIGYLAQSRKQRPTPNNDVTEKNTEIAVFVVGGVTAGTAAASIVLHVFAKTRERIEKSRTAWFTLALNFAIFVTWIILVLINVVVVDCSRKTDGEWCMNLKNSLATGLVSAMLALIIVLRSFTESEEELEARLVEHLRDVYRRDLLVDARTKKVALVESALVPVALRLAVVRVLLGNLRVPQVSFYPGSVAALMTCGSVHAGLVVDCGHRMVTVTPVYEARALSPYATSTPLAGSALFENLRGLLRKYARFTPASSLVDMDCREGVLTDTVVSHVMTKLLVASPIAPPDRLRGTLGAVDGDVSALSNELVAFYESNSTCASATMRLTIDSERYGRGLLLIPSWIRERAAEPLFCGDPGADLQSIPDIIVQCIGRVPLDTRRALVANVLVIGGVAELPGFRHRLLHDVVDRLRGSRWAALTADAALAGDESGFAPSARAWIGTSLAVAAKIGTAEVSRDEFDGCTLPDWTAIAQ
ncbi:hypothetical protein GGI18_000065 [Coemansia linderi]|uniref:Uncharacterized protein n=1 Tax=Coemansia linderi TaxID=2663919 RepID=A0ACC1KPV9_9FUNG|nr:hypothetical protein GGI18_000065 [Coemansia linderi]